MLTLEVTITRKGAIKLKVACGVAEMDAEGARAVAQLLLLKVAELEAQSVRK